MTDKPDQARLRSRKPSKNKAAIRIPISLHFYAVEIVIIVLVVFIINFYIQSIVKNYIANECNSRLDAAVNSTQEFANAFSSQISASDEKTKENIRAILVDSIVSSADLSNQATIALYTLDKETGEYILLWPTAYYSASYANMASNVVGNVIEEQGYMELNKTQTIDIDGNIIYYRSVQFNVKQKVSDDDTVEIDPDSAMEETIDLDEYYLCVYVNSSSYYSFMAAMTLALIQAALLAILIAGILSMLMTYPLIFSTQKLSRFAKRVAKGDFTPSRGHIVSKELSELGDVMNQMALQ